jgi:hypothetical protein
MNYVGMFLMVFADRFRGYPGLLPKQAKRIIEAYVMTLCLGHWNDWTALAITTAIWAGICLGSYGNVIGPATAGTQMARAKSRYNSGPEWWQRGVLLDNVWLALVVLGLIWSLPGAVVGYAMGAHNAVALVPALVIAYPLSCHLANYMQEHTDPAHMDYAWAKQQWLLGLLVSIMLGVLA